MAKTIVFFSTKGGVGKTLIATNVAVSLAREYSRRTLLVDLDLEVVGDMGRMLNVRSQQKALVDLIAYLKKKPAQVPKKEFLTESDFGVDFLPGVLRPQQSPHLEAEYIPEVFKLLGEDYDYIIVGAGKVFSETLVAALSEANLIVLVVTPDILSIYQTKWTLDTLQTLHFPLSVIKIGLNRADSVASISLQDIAGNLNCEIISLVPSEGKIVGNAVNRSIPVVIDSPRSKFAVAISRFCERLVRDKSIFMEHREIGQLPIKDFVQEKSAQLWEKEGLTDVLVEKPADETDEILVLKSRVQKRLIDELNLKKMDLKVFSDPKKTRELRERAAIVVANLLAEEAGSLISSHEVRKKLVKETLDEALGLGPLEDLLADPAITDIMVNNKDEVYVEKHGKIQFTSKKFVSNEQVKTIIERIIAPIGRRIDESVPMVDARLPDGSRVNAIIPPLSLTGPTLTIRKFRKERFTQKELISLNTLDAKMAEFLKACVLSRKNIIVSGGTGSGKTTILNVLSQFIPDTERIVTLEDAAELKLHQTHWVRLESRPPNIEGRGSIAIRDLFRNTLRMRPDRIIIGECRSVEAMDMLQAMNTGHDGSLTTIHANSTHDVFVRLDSMILMAGVELPIRAIREMVSSAIDVVVHTARLSDGSRKIIQITDVTGMKDDTHIDLKDIFAFKQSGIDGQGNVLGVFQPTGYIPSFIEDIKVKGIVLADSIFTPSP